MSINNDSTYNLIKKGLDMSTLRGKLISNNVANINTKDYKRYYINFEDAMKGANENLSLKTTKEQHIGGNNSSLESNVQKDKSTSMRTDGNNVDLDLEKVDQAANTMMFNALVTRANGKLGLTNYIISGGN